VILSAADVAGSGSGVNINAAPVITLKGAAAAQVPVGMPYFACGVGRAVSPGTPCDPGAMALDKEDGDVSRHVTVCAPQGVYTSLFKNIGVSGCRVDTSVPGKHVITFRVTDSAGKSAAVNRTVLVVPACLGNERVCPGTLVCSIGQGFCDDGGAEADALAVVGLPLFTSRYFLQLQNTVQLMRARIVHVTNLTPPGEWSDNPSMSYSRRRQLS
jgi:hypothetical protein